MVVSKYTPRRFQYFFELATHAIAGHCINGNVSSSYVSEYVEYTQLI